MCRGISASFFQCKSTTVFSMFATLRIHHYLSLQKFNVSPSLVFRAHISIYDEVWCSNLWLLNRNVEKSIVCD